ncbi:MAG: DUF4369 domain-containing protein, partial [Chitinophagaceae bacterium]
MAPIPGLAQTAGHDIRIQIPQWKDTTLFLGNYYGKQTYVFDSARLNQEGEAVFQGNQPIPRGIYFVLMPNKIKYFEMLIGSNQDFSIRADTTDLIHQVDFTNSPENQRFYAYNDYLAKLNPKEMALAKSLREAGSKTDSTAIQVK